MKLWIDDVRPAPEGYIWCRSVYEAIDCIIARETRIGILEYDDVLSDKRKEELSIQLIDLDHDAGDYARFGGDYINLLDWLEKTGKNYPIRIHTQNPVGRENMERIIRKNGWRLVK